MTYSVLVQTRTEIVESVGRVVRLPLPSETYLRVLTFPGNAPANLIPWKTKINPQGQITVIADDPIPVLRQTVFQTLQQLQGWVRGIEAIKDNFPSQDVVVGLDMLAYAVRGVYGVVKSSHWSEQQKITYCQMLARGASDVNSPQVFFPYIENERLEGRGLSSPPGAFGWVNPNTGIQLPLKRAVELSVQHQVNYAPDPLLITFSSEEWVASVS